MTQQFEGSPRVFREGLSSTGSKHGLLVEPGKDGIRFVVTGVNGKRHAAVTLAYGDTANVVDWLTAFEPEGLDER